MPIPSCASHDFLQDVLLASNRHQSTDYRVRLTDVNDTFGPNAPFILGQVEELVDNLPTKDNGMLEVKWGHDDERSFPPLPGSESEQGAYDLPNWRLTYTDAAVYLSPVPGSGAGPITFWFSHEDDHQTFDTGEPQAHGYVNQD